MMVLQSILLQSQLSQKSPYYIHCEWKVADPLPWFSFSFKLYSNGLTLITDSWAPGFYYYSSIRKSCSYAANRKRFGFWLVSFLEVGSVFVISWPKLAANYIKSNPLLLQSEVNSTIHCISLSLFFPHCIPWSIPQFGLDQKKKT